MTDITTKAEELRRYFPRPYYNLQDGKGLAILLDVIGEDLDSLFSDVAAGREQYILSRAVKDYLQLHGTNLDVFKPRGSNMRDGSYRRLIQIISNSTKNREKVFEDVLRLFFGPQVFNRNYADIGSWRPNEIVLRISSTALIVAISRELRGTAYLHTLTEPFTGAVSTQFSTTISGNYPIGTTEMTIASVPAGMPLVGVVEIGDASTPLWELKVFERSGSTLRLISPTLFQHFDGDTLIGPERPNDYPNAYIYNEPITSTNTGTLNVGDTVVNVVVDSESFPDQGVIYIGDPTSNTFEAKGYSRAGTVFTLEGGLSYAHSSGEKVAVPSMYRRLKLTLNAAISAGSSTSTISVSNAADYPLAWAAVSINRGYDNEELVPFRGRVVGNNGLLNIDPGYVFKRDHDVGETIHLMARINNVSKSGSEYPMYLVDSANLRDQFLSIIRRLKISGIRLTIEYF